MGVTVAIPVFVCASAAAVPRIRVYLRGRYTSDQRNSLKRSSRLPQEEGCLLTNSFGGDIYACAVCLRNH
jgi:hypothetical protein